MDEVHREILRKNRSYLVKEIEDVHGITDYLHEKDILTVNMVQDILAEKTPISQTRKLLDILPKRGQFAFDTFCNVLIKTGQREIAKNLNPQLIHSGVTVVNPERKSAINSTAHTKSSSSEQPAGVNQLQPAYPVPVQMPVDQNKNLPQSSAFGASGSQPCTPNDDRYQQSVFGTQESREDNPYDHTAEEILDDFPKPRQDWPKLNLKLASKDFEVKRCTGDEVKKQLNNPNVYPMSEDKERRAFIINNKTFDGELYEERKFTDIDSIRIHQVLKKMDFKIETSSNLKKEELENVLSVEREQDRTNLCMFVLVILSYGGSGTIMCTDGDMIPVQDIVNMFSAKNCPSMNGVPKLFLIQACGTIMKNVDGKPDEPTSKLDSARQAVIAGIESLNLGMAAAGKTVVDTRGSLHSSSSESSLSDPLALEDRSDMLVAMATTADTNQPEYTSLFMLALSYVISNFSKSYHFVSLLKGINMLKCDDSGNAVKLCEFKNSLSKKLYLLPGYPHDTPGNATGYHSHGPFGSTKLS